MERRAHFGHMDWEWENGRGAVDATSPFAQVQPQRTPAAQPSASSSSSQSNSQNNPFNGAARQTSPTRNPFAAAPPSRSIFSPNLQRTSKGSAFRNVTFTTPAFSTPQTSRLADIDFDDSPAMTEASELQETPEAEKSDFLESPSMSSPERPARSVAQAMRSGKGSLPRATGVGLPNDRVRKRARNNRDRDIGSTRTRLPGGCDEDDSDFEEYNDSRDRRAKSRENMGWLYYILSTISSNPEAPIIFSWYLQVFVNSSLGGLLLWTAWGIVSAVRGEVIYSSEKAKLNLLAEIEQCSKQYAANRCSPISERAPALEHLCNEWDQCMTQDPNSVAGVKASVSHLADIINEFTSRLSWKSITVILIFAVVLVFANNMAFSKFRQHVRHYNQQRPGEAQPSHPAMGFPMTPHKPDQAYIFAPIGHTPKHIRRALFQDETDTDASPDLKLLPPVRTPSRRSPSKGERSRSPSKRSR
ncbi:hypothetical protein M406DRAFT_219453, partial [Cryphonectria parasitica EP155]